MAKHAVLSPSAAHRWLACPGSVQLCATLPKPPPSTFADEGTAAHTQLDRVVTGKDPLPVITLNGADYEYDAEMQNHTEQSAKYILEHAEGGQMWTEERLYCKTVSPDVWGRGDVVIWHEDFGVLESIDYKYGAGNYVSALENPQLRIYSIGAIDTLIEDWDAVDMVRSTVVQPRYASNEPIHRTETLTGDELRAWRDDVLRPGVIATAVANPEFNVGDHCTFCPAKQLNRCPARNAQVDEAFKMINEGVPKTRDDLAKAMSLVPLAKEWCKQVEAETRLAIEHGEDVPGWKIVEGRAGARQWKDEAAATKRFRALIKDQAFAPKKLKSPAQMEKLVAREAVAEMAFSPPSKSTNLVPASDKKPAISFVSPFSEVTEEAGPFG